MKKKVLFVCLLILTIVSMISAGGSQEAEDGVDQGVKVAVLTIRKLTTPADLNTLEGITKLRDELGYEVNVIECTEISEYKEQVLSVSEEGYDIVYFIYDNFLPAVIEIAPHFPDTKYIGLWIDLAGKDAAPNVKPLFFRPEQGSYMAGVVAAKMTKTNKVAFLGGGISPGILTFLAGFEAGIKKVNPGVELIPAWANTFEDPIKGREMALSLYSRDVDIIFQVANQTGLGVFKAAQEVDGYVIGVDVDQSSLAPENVIASVLLDHGYATYDSVKDAGEGRFTNEQVYYGIAEGTPVIAITDLVSSSLQNEIKKIEEEIAGGRIEVPKVTDLQ